ncbi:alpha/beta fold hydrolase [Phreatobacter oligotrophus]|uniref:alpha/beta fold hydrolase n=1 Tax=Phreatobacter oligotrophus TaxID=1122261 RepID=UPI0023534B7E|nr:alpha/beta hydrolase [Phreatobacter oligotrophus]MBX9990258.1 alpha/beta hydrolase [Phreatobacter oligotrophus]
MSLQPRQATFLGHAGNRLAADLYGQGPQVALLLHGGGQTRHAWRATARRLADRGFTAVCVDQRGHGDSEWVAGGHYSFADFGRDAVALGRQVEERFGAKAAAIGASLGGIASLHALGQEPCFSSLILVDIVPRMEEQGVRHVQGFMRAHAATGFATIEEAAESVAAYLPHRRRPPSVEGLKKNLRLKPDGRWYWHWDPAFLDGGRPVDGERATIVQRLEDDARRLTVPTLLVRGASSDIVSPESVEAFLALVPHARFVDVGGAGHMVAGDKNDVFAEAILDFLG